MCVITLVLEELQARPQEPAHATQIKWLSNQNWFISDPQISDCMTVTHSRSKKKNQSLPRWTECGFNVPPCCWQEVRLSFFFFFSSKVHTCMPKEWHHTIATVWQRAWLRCKGWFIRKDRGDVLKAKRIPRHLKSQKAHPAIFCKGNDAACSRDAFNDETERRAVLCTSFFQTDTLQTGETSKFWRHFPLRECGYTAPSCVLMLALSRFSKNRRRETPADNFSF